MDDDSGGRVHRSARRRSIEVHVIARPDEDDEEFGGGCGGAGGSGVSVNHRALGCPRLG